MRKIKLKESCLLVGPDLLTQHQGPTTPSLLPDLARLFILNY